MFSLPIDLPPEPISYSMVVFSAPVYSIDSSPNLSIEGWVHDYCYKAGNSLAMKSVTVDVVTETYRPRTRLGKKLIELRRAYVYRGGELMSAVALDKELRSRRGGIGSV